MARIHFLNVLEGDCNIIQHDKGRTTVIDVSNAYNEQDTPEEKAARESEVREMRRNRTQVPTGKVDYKQKLSPDNPIIYLRDRLKIKDIFRFIITHPDMDHLDGIKDLYDEFNIGNTWDTNNNKEIEDGVGFAGYNQEDWKFYKNLRDGKNAAITRLTYDYTCNNLYFNEDDLQILSPSPELIKAANKSGDYNDLSYVLLFTPPKEGGGIWKILFSGDSHDGTWEHILATNRDAVKNIDVLFAPHHGRGSGRNYDFLKTLNPKLTLFGNASSRHLDYNSYPKFRMTNNQAGYIVLDISQQRLLVAVKNYDYARDYRLKKGWSEPTYDNGLGAWPIFQYNA